MGSGVSKTTLPQVRAALFNNKPVDASDITDLAMAKDEITKLRVLALQLYKAHEDALRETATDEEKSNAPPERKPKARAAIYAGAANMEAYEHKVVEKAEETRALILKSISDSILFKACEDKELQALVDAFAPTSADAGDTVIKQGEQGDDFFVVESGCLRVFVVFPGTTTEVEVRAPYKRGESFGELSLMYNSPRAATIRADDASKLWSISRGTVRAIMTQRKKQDMQQRLDLLSKIVIGGTKLCDSLSQAELQQLAVALELEEFAENEVIVRQGEAGDAFYIIETGEVSVFKHEDADDNSPETSDAPADIGGSGTAGSGVSVATSAANAALGRQVGMLRQGDYFGERALLSEERRAASVVAKVDGVRCLSLGRDDFDRMLGSLQDLMARTAGIERKAADEAAANDGRGSSAGSGGANSQRHAHYLSVKPEELEVIRTLGAGAFGNVKLVRHKPLDRCFALKCQAKKAILENDLQQHVLDERRLLMELDHPFILKLHDSFQDDRYIYFVLEVLMGGELFMHLRHAGNFSENDAKFYSASVLHAFDYIHARKIAYRDLKPENLVLDASGYVKIVDFGLAKVIPSGITWTICGTPDYLAPEIILNEGHDYAVDYWALGVLIFEMCAGVPPFYAEDPMATYEKILSNKLSLPDSFSKNLKDILRKLLKLNKSKRLGKTRGGASAVMKHKWYSGFNWDGLVQRAIDPPIVPTLKSPSDASNFDAANADLEDPPAPECPEWVPDF